MTTSTTVLCMVGCTNTVTCRLNSCGQFELYSRACPNGCGIDAGFTCQSHSPDRPHLLMELTKRFISKIRIAPTQHYFFHQRYHVALRNSILPTKHTPKKNVIDFMECIQ